MRRTKNPYRTSDEWITTTCNTKDKDYSQTNRQTDGNAAVTTSGGI